MLLRSDGGGVSRDPVGFVDGSEGVGEKRSGGAGVFGWSVSAAGGSSGSSTVLTISSGPARSDGMLETLGFLPVARSLPASCRDPSGFFISSVRDCPDRASVFRGDILTLSVDSLAKVAIQGP